MILYRCKYASDSEKIIDRWEETSYQTKSRLKNVPTASRVVHPRSCSVRNRKSFCVEKDAEEEAEEMKEDRDETPFLDDMLCGGCEHCSRFKQGKSSVSRKVHQLLLKLVVPEGFARGKSESAIAARTDYFRAKALKAEAFNYTEARKCLKEQDLQEQATNPDP